MEAGDAAKSTDGERRKETNMKDDLCLYEPRFATRVMPVALRGDNTIAQGPVRRARGPIRPPYPRLLLQSRRKRNKGPGPRDKARPVLRGQT